VMQLAWELKNCKTMNYSNKKSLILLFFALLVTTFISAQKIWLDDDWRETAKEKSNFYRTKPKKLSDIFEILHYYKSGNLQLKGYSKTAYPSKDGFEGIVYLYYETGEVKEERYYSEGVREGVWKSFHKSGKIKTKGKYRNGEKVGVWKTFYKNVYDDFYNMN